MLASVVGCLIVAWLFTLIGQKVTSIAPHQLTDWWPRKVQRSNKVTSYSVTWAHTKSNVSYYQQNKYYRINSFLANDKKHTRQNPRHIFYTCFYYAGFFFWQFDFFFYIILFWFHTKYVNGKHKINWVLVKMLYLTYQ